MRERKRLKMDKTACRNCGHAGTVSGVAKLQCCDYLADQNEHGLPPRPWPRPLPQECLYRSRKSDKAGSLSRQEARDILHPPHRRGRPERPVLHVDTGTLYSGATAAAMASGESREDIRRACAASRRDWYEAEEYRYLTSEEMELIRRTAFGWEGWV